MIVSELGLLSVAFGPSVKFLLQILCNEQVKFRKNIPVQLKTIESTELKNIYIHWAGKLL